MVGEWLGLFLKACLALIVAFCFFRQYFTKGYLMKGTRLELDADLVPIYRKHRKKIDLSILFIIGIFAINIIMEGLIPLLRDVPFILRGEYEVIIGITVSRDAGRWELGDERDIEIEDLETGDRVVVHCFTTGIREGEYVIVHYLPYSKSGEIIERVDLND